MRFLVGLSNLTRKPAYKKAFQDSIRYNFEHYQTESGLLHMGHHRFVDLQKDNYDGDGHPPGFAHELKINFPYYDLFFKTEPKASRKLVEGIWNTHIKDWSNLNFTRHAGYGRKWSEGIWDRQFDESVKGIIPGALTFYDTACDLILAAGKLYQFAGDEKPLLWARRLLGRYIHSAHPKTGLPPYQHTQQGNRVANQGLPANATEPTTLVYSGGAKCNPPDSLFGYGAIVLMRLGEALREDGTFFRKSVHDYLKAYAKYAYNWEDNILRPLVYDGTDLSGFVNKGDGYCGAKGTVLSPWKAHTGYMLSYALCYHQTKDKEIWDTLRGICRGNGLGDIGEAGGRTPKLNFDTTEVEPDIIFSMVEIFRATDNKAHLDLARVVGNNALKMRYSAEKGLFIFSKQHLIANLDTREPLALITLEAALRGQLEKVPTYDGNGRFMWARIPGMAGQVSDPWYQVLRSKDWDIDAKWNVDRDGRWTNAGNWIPGSPRGWWGDIAVFPDVITTDRTIDTNGYQEACTGLVFDADHSYTLTGGGITVRNAISVIVRKGSHTIENDFTAHGGAAVPRDITFDIAAGATLTQHGLILRLYSPPGFNIGVRKIGAGTLIMTADQGAAPDNHYPSRTIVSSGTLLINNRTGSGVGRDSVIVEKTGTLGGTGIVGSAVDIHAHGAVAPGNGSAGTLILSDGLTLRGGSVLRFELGTRSDLIDINSGMFTVSGNKAVTVSIADGGGLRPTKYKLIDWTGASVSGLDAGDFHLKTGGSVQEANFSIDGNTLQVTVQSLATGR
jgi:pectate lyase